MTKCLVTGLLLSSATLTVSAQWTTKDSLNLVRVLTGGEELKLNQEAVRQIEFSKMTGTPSMSQEKSWLLPDASLPSALPHNKAKVVLTLFPYKATTRYDWDPILQKKIKVGKDTWRGDIFYQMKNQTEYTNQEKIAGGTQGGPPSTSAGVGVTIGGLNLMRVFEKSFWDTEGNERRSRTLEVLKAYGDSTTVGVRHAVMQSIVR